MSADANPSLRPSDSWSSTEVKTQKHSHVWNIKGFSSCEARYLETSVKPLPTDQNLIFRIRLHPQGNKESNKDFTFFQVFCNKNDTKYRAKFTAYNSRNEEITTTVYTGTQQLHGYFEYIRRDLLLNHLPPDDELNLLCDLNITFDTITKSCYNSRPLVAAKIETKELEVADDFEKLFGENRLSDFSIVCGDRKFPVHKAVLFARSPVFAAMLEHDTEESQNGYVQLDDLDAEAVSDMLHYIYSGRAPNLRDGAADLLGIADRFALTGLKEMADQVLRSSLSVDSVCKILVLADMHGALQLRTDAVRFAAQNSQEVIQTEGWQLLITQQPHLVTDVVSAITSGVVNDPFGCPPMGGTMTSSSHDGPAAKRGRFGLLTPKTGN